MEELYRSDESKSNSIRTLIGKYEANFSTRKQVGMQECSQLGSKAEIDKVGVDFFIPLSVSQVPERCKSCWIKVGCARESLRPITPFLSSFVRIPNDSRNESQKR